MYIVEFEESPIHASYERPRSIRVFRYKLSELRGFCERQRLVAVHNILNILFVDLVGAVFVQFLLA